MLLNLGPTCADGVPGVEKIEIASGAILRRVAKTVMYVLWNAHYCLLLRLLKWYSSSTRLEDRSYAGEWN